MTSATVPLLAPEASISQQQVTTTDLIEQLKRPDAYEQALDDVGFLQTHISLLFFAGERVYKIKKPVDFGFLDYTSLEARHRFCEAEVQLNRRLSPDIYLGVVAINQADDGSLHIGGTGTTVEWAVEMVRLPAQRMLSELLERGEIDNAQMNAMAALLVEFHASVETGPGIDEYGTPAAIRSNIEENFAQLEPFVGDVKNGTAVVSAVQHAFLVERAASTLASHEARLEERVRAGRIREGHGDLHAGNICFTPDGIKIYDCIEFNRRFRCGDVASEIAFLAMDLDYRGYPGFSQYLVRRYAEAAADPGLLQLKVLYKAYRAVVRGKVAAFASSDRGVAQQQRAESRAEAMRYLQLAAAYDLQPAMFLMCGLPASGKSWLAKRLAASFRAAVLRSDVRRKLLFGLNPTDHEQAAIDHGLYAPELTDKTYRSLLDDGLRHLRAGHSVILDATFSKRDVRSAFVDAATRLDLPYWVIHVSASDALTRERLEQRQHDVHEVSDANLQVYLAARDSFEPPNEVPYGHLVSVESGAGVPEEESSAVIDLMISLQANRTE